MASLDKLLGKIEKAQSAIKSFKGTVSKFKNLNFNSLVDALGEQRGLANKILDARRSSLQRQLDARNVSKQACKGKPDMSVIDLYYPNYLPAIENMITFSTRKRNMHGNTSRSGIDTNDGLMEVHLYVPDTLLSQANVQYKNEGVGAIQQALGDVLSNPSEALKNLDGSALESVAGKMVLGMANGVTGGALGAKAGIALNPMREMMFEGIGFRSWNFTYELYPRSQMEADTINKIIYAFRTAMLPDSFKMDLFGKGDSDTGTDGTTLADTFFNYPNVFDISFEGPIAKKLDGFLPAVCTKCDVDHTGGQKFSVYRDGQPVKSTMTLEFMEIRILTQQNYQAVSPVSNNIGGPGDKLKSKDTSIYEGNKRDENGDWRRISHKEIKESWMKATGTNGEGG